MIQLRSLPRLSAQEQNRKQYELNQEHDPTALVPFLVKQYLPLQLLILGPQRGQFIVNRLFAHRKSQEAFGSY